MAQDRERDELKDKSSRNDLHDDVTPSRSSAHSQQSSSPQLQVSPVRASCRASRPSCTRKYTRTSAARGSAHHQPKSRLSSSPTRSVKDMYAQVTLQAASALSAALPIRLATRSLPCHKSGMMMAAAMARPTPHQEASGCALVTKAKPLSPTM